MTAGDPLSAAVAALVRAQPRDFHAIRQEWAAVRIQSAFRALLVMSNIYIYIYTFLKY